jgi:hypothetical protein
VKFVKPVKPPQVSSRTQRGICVLIKKSVLSTNLRPAACQPWKAAIVRDPAGRDAGATRWHANTICMDPVHRRCTGDSTGVWGLAEHFLRVRHRRDRIADFPAGSGRIAAATSAPGCLCLVDKSGEKCFLLQSVSGRRLHLVRTSMSTRIRRSVT